MCQLFRFVASKTINVFNKYVSQSKTFNNIHYIIMYIVWEGTYFI